MLVQAYSDALSPAVERAGERRWRPAVAASRQDRCDAPEFDKCEIGREVYPLYNHRASVGAAGAWLAFYLIIVIHYFMAAGN